MSDLPQPDSPQAWRRLASALALMTVGSAGMYVVSVVLPAVQAEFGITRAQAALPYTAMMIGFGLGGMLMGRLADRFGVRLPVLLGTLGIAGGFALAAMAPGIGVFTLAHGLLLGLVGCSATFAPLVADTTLWFVRRRGIAVAICASGNYVAGALWPPLVQWLVEQHGWRSAYLVLAGVSLVVLPLLAQGLRTRPPAFVAAPARAGRAMPVPSARRCRASRCCCSCPSTAWCRCT